MEHDAVVYNTCLDACSKQSRLDLVDKLLKDPLLRFVSRTLMTCAATMMTCVSASFDTHTECQYPLAIEMFYSRVCFVLAVVQA